MNPDGTHSRNQAHAAAKRLKNFSHIILQHLARTTPIWGYPALIAGDGFPFVNQRAKQVPTIMIDVKTDAGDDITIRTLGLVLTESIRTYSESREGEGETSHGVQMMTLNNGSDTYSFIIQALGSQDLGELPYFLHVHRYHILKTAFAVIDEISTTQSQENSAHVFM